MVLEPPIARTLPQGRRSALFVSCACGAILLAVGIYPAAIMNIVATVRIPDAKPTPDAPAGSTRGSATASQ